MSKPKLEWRDIEWIRTVNADERRGYLVPKLKAMQLCYTVVVDDAGMSLEDMKSVALEGKRSFCKQLIDLRDELNGLDLDGLPL